MEPTGLEKASGRVLAEPSPSMAPARSTASEVFTSRPMDFAAASRSPPFALALSASCVAFWSTNLFNFSATSASCTLLCTSSNAEGWGGTSPMQDAMAILFPAIATGWETSPFFKLAIASWKSLLAPTSGRGSPAPTFGAFTYCTPKSAATLSGCSGSLVSAACTLSDSCCTMSFTRCFLYPAASSGFTSLNGFSCACSWPSTCRMW